MVLLLKREQFWHQKIVRKLLIEQFHTWKLYDNHFSLKKYILRWNFFSPVLVANLILQKETYPSWKKFGTKKINQKNTFFSNFIHEICMIQYLSIERITFEVKIFHPCFGCALDSVLKYTLYEKKIACQI